MLDQIQALEWVRRNVASFGGQPQQVTVMGLAKIAPIPAFPRCAGEGVGLSVHVGLNPLQAARLHKSKSPGSARGLA